MLGLPVANELAHRGISVRVISRRTFRPRSEHMESVAADVGDRGKLARAMDGCRAVHISLQGGPRAEDYLRLEGDGVRAIAAIAGEQGMERITLLSGLGVAAVNERMIERGDRIPAPAFAKYHGEEAVRKCGVPYSIFRPSNFTDGLERSVMGKRAFVPGFARAEYHWLAAGEYARIVADALAGPGQPTGTWAVLGPERLTIREAMEQYLEALYPDVRLVAMPRLVAGVVALFNPALRIGLSMLNLTDRYTEDELAAVSDGIHRLTTTVDECCAAIARGRMVAATGGANGHAGQVVAAA